MLFEVCWDLKSMNVYVSPDFGSFCHYNFKDLFLLHPLSFLLESPMICFLEFWYFLKGTEGLYSFLSFLDWIISIDLFSILVIDYFLFHITLLFKPMWWIILFCVYFSHFTFCFVLFCCCLSHVQLFVTPWTVARQAPLPMGFPRQEYWSGLPFPSQSIFLAQGSLCCHTEYFHCSKSPLCSAYSSLPPPTTTRP